MTLVLFVEIIVAIAAIIHGILYTYKFVCWVRSRPVKDALASPKRDLVIGTFYSLLCAVLWSASYVSLSYVSQKTDIFSINVVLLGCGSIFLAIGWFVARFRRAIERQPPLPNTSWCTATPWITAVGNLLNFVLFTYALYFISASQTITLNKINPLFVAFLTWFWLTRKPPRSAFSAVVLVVLGTMLITANDQFGFDWGRELCPFGTPA